MSIGKVSFNKYFLSSWRKKLIFLTWRSAGYCRRRCGADHVDSWVRARTDGRVNMQRNMDTWMSCREVPGRSPGVQPGRAHRVRALSRVQPAASRPGAQAVPLELQVASDGSVVDYYYYFVLFSSCCRGWELSPLSGGGGGGVTRFNLPGKVLKWE